MSRIRLAYCAVTFVLQATLLSAQGAPPAAPAAAPQPPLPPATKLEAFKPDAGSLVTLGRDVLKLPWNMIGVTVEVREIRAASGLTARGVVVGVRESQYRSETAFIDADELPELVRGINALLDIKTNPTPFTGFEVRYATRGGLVIAAYGSDKVSFAMSAGRLLTTSLGDINAKHLEAFRGAIEQAQAKLATLPAK